MSSVIRDLNFVKWKLAGRPQRADTANVMIRPRSWDVDPKGNSNLRDAAVRLEIAYETFDADPAAIQDNIVLAMGALVLCLDLLRVWSDAHDGTVIDIVEPIGFTIGEFDGPTSSGFIATVTIRERGDE
jgi:hypothetical protein